jgi:uncharacterized protein YndB with AHSA1/START domain
MAKYKKFEIEYTVHASSKLLYEFLTSPSGLSEWFADDVNITRDGDVTFFWDGSEQKAKVLSKKENSMVRYKWVDEPKDTYFEFRIEVDDITSDVALIITDFAEDDEAIAASKLLWDTQIHTLMKALGSN